VIYAARRGFVRLRAVAIDTQQAVAFSWTRTAVAPIYESEIRRRNQVAPAAAWATPADAKRVIRSASILKDGRAVFNLAGNKYRLVLWLPMRRRP
jgi:mRNA interferase HigB